MTCDKLKMYDFSKSGELKAYNVHMSSNGKFCDMYLKYEADKVITELKAQKAQAEDDCAYWKMSEGNAANAMHETEEYAMQLYKELRNSNRKRCLAMAEMCKARYDEEDAKLNRWGSSWDYVSEEMKYWERWQWRWEELAEEPTWAKFLQLIHK